jgi:4-amino-4-deoxy-L-arabinose transferase-like glycosyltransferase
MLSPATPLKDRHLPFTLPRRISKIDIAAGGMILLSALFRLILLVQGWPLTNSDEGTMGLMALNIAYQGEHPTFFYGQHYMGSLEAFLAAGLFHVFGSSLFTLRLGTTLMIALALVGMYWLSRLLFPPTWALISLLLVSVSSGFAMAEEMRAIGGYAETLLFSTILFLCATWLVLTYQRHLSGHVPIRRFLLYLLWGLTAGLGLWTDLLIAPAIIASGLLLLTICWRELLRPLPLLCLLTGLCIGAFPLISYNLHAAPNEDSLSVFRGLHDQGGIALYTPSALLHEMSNTLSISLPLMIGEPFCPVTEIAFLGPTSAPGLACTITRSAWGLGYLLLLILSCALVGCSAWQFWRKRKQRDETPELQRQWRQQLACLALLLGALLTLASYTFSSAPLIGPGIHARYLICLLLATPAIFWPLQIGIQNRKNAARPGLRTLSIAMLCTGILVLFCGLNVLGSILSFSELPAASTQNQQDAALIHELAHLQIHHIYTGYWTCDKIAFESDEQTSCAVLNSKLQLDYHYSRYTPYVAAVTADPHAAYVFPLSHEQFPLAHAYAALTNANTALSMLPAPFNHGYNRIVLAGYVIYSPAFANVIPE